MFIKKIKSPKGDVYLQLAESYRQGKKVLHRTLTPLGKAGDGRMENLTQAVLRYAGEKTAEDFLAKNLKIKKTFVLGPLLILNRLFEKLGINQAVKELPKSKKTKFDIQKILFALVASRFANPGSKLKVFEKHQKAFYPGLFSSDIKLHQIYRALDFLADNKSEIERSLYQHGRDWFDLQTDIVLYDLTTLRFESRRTDLGELRQFGYSKEKRSDCTQAVLGLLTDREGLPLGFEVYPGNTFEGKTVSDIERKLRKKFKVRRFVFVGDRGIFSKKNLESLSKKGGEFIVGMKLGSIRSRHKEFYDTSRFQRINDDLSVYETEYDGDRLIVTWSAKRAERDKKAREDILLKIEKKLQSPGKGARQFITNEAYKKYVRLGEGNKKPGLNKKAILEEEKKDGFFGVVTNVQDMSAPALISHYKGLWIIEDAFRELKGTLKARPVFHWTDKRIVGHLVMCFIAYLCGAYLTRELRKRGSVLKSVAVDSGAIARRPLTAAEGMRDLLEVRAVPVEVKGSVIWVRTEIEGNAAEIFRAAGVQPPKRLLKFSAKKSAEKAVFQV